MSRKTRSAQRNFEGALATAVREERASAAVVAKGLDQARKPVVVPLSERAKRMPRPSARRAHAADAVRIFQIFYDEWHKPLLDADFEPYDNSGESSELHEFAVFEKLAASPKVQGATLWGALSWRFTEKTGLNGKALREVIAAHPGHDVYFCNPFPENESLYHNVWAQGQVSHPSFLELARAFFDAAALPRDTLECIQPSTGFCAANYFVATPAFWPAYLQFVRRSLGNAERKLPANMRALLHSKAADPTGFHFGATYIPFIIERLFAVFLATDGARFKAFKINLPERDGNLNVHMRLLRDMRDVAHRTRSVWLAACWVNYRNLYMSHVHGKEWCREHLPRITPSQVKFG